MRKPNSAGMLPFLIHQQHIAEGRHPGAVKRTTLEREGMPQILKDLRLQSGLSQSQAAKLCLSTLREWREWESGRVRMRPTDFKAFIRALVEYHGWPAAPNRGSVPA